MLKACLSVLVQYFLRLPEVLTESSVLVKCSALALGRALLRVGCGHS